MNDMNHMYSRRVTLVRPTDEIEVDYFFYLEKVYTIDGWYFCPDTHNEWYVSKGKAIFTFVRKDEKLGNIYYSYCSPKFGFCTKDECERILKLKVFW